MNIPYRERVPKLRQLSEPEGESQPRVHTVYRQPSEDGLVFPMSLSNTNTNAMDRQENKNAPVTLIYSREATVTIPPDQVGSKLPSAIDTLLRLGQQGQEPTVAEPSSPLSPSQLTIIRNTRQGDDHSDATSLMRSQEKQPTIPQTQQDLSPRDVHFDNHLAEPLLAAERGERGPPSPPRTQGSAMYWKNILLVANAILGVGVVAMPRVYSELGLVIGSILLAITALLVIASALVLTRSGRHSYNDLIMDTMGSTGVVLWDASIAVLTFGLMVVYLKVLDDVLGSGFLPGYGDSRVALVVISIVVLAPLVAVRGTAAKGNYLGVASVGVFAASVLILLMAAINQHKIHHLDTWPSVDRAGWVPEMAQLLATLPVLLVALGCHTALFQVEDESMIRCDNSKKRKVTIASVTLCACVYALVGIGGWALFGANMHGDILKDFSQDVLVDLAGETWGRALFLAVRISFGISLIAGFPLLMQSFRQSLWRLLFLQELLAGPGFLVVSWLILASTVLVAMKLSTVWIPLQLIGATAGAMVALILPGIGAVKYQDDYRPIRSSMMSGLGYILVISGFLVAIFGLIGAITR